MKSRKNAVCLVLLAVLNTISLKAQMNDKYGVLTFNNAINISGKQRMLTQKMTKAYLYLLNYSNDPKAKKDLMTSQVIFEEQNRILSENTVDKETIEKLNKVKELWKEYKKNLETRSNYENAKRIIDINTDLLKATNSVVLSIINESKKSFQKIDEVIDEEYKIEDKLELERIIDISGRQRMLSQRLGLYYYANHTELKDKNSEQMLVNVFHELDGAANKLLVSKFNTAEIDEKIGLAFSKWNTMKKNKIKLLRREFKDEEIYKISNELARLFNDVTIQYEKIKL
ncbi:type IV pili methyl-accepting chemotaxis transducer N-terminal domain-containing protein [Aquimarina sp. 2201CG5-10]|uniref:type IV pili methyl-accepting chemotaxis transducer N-terminal domain-containing protein n=1 Tax=Aquimarina callyspongiae TaxID=3098150 RepID=UPI002AB53BD8|nr:type IV pili methyl-accepting chemotaxis transducer N-terminal domain-containing protein [Aquimarina sp. 2201CG5-10]MDY8134097.1 type IV pili methyl-accepting chemotaxis transducer N-terminal domain-containing protein [Aquimarina sp. 2201CG5-10]